MAGSGHLARFAVDRGMSAAGDEQPVGPYAYSVRGQPGGPVSAPVTWDELPDVEIEDFTIASMPSRFAELGDLHEGIGDAVWSIEPLLDWADRDERDHGLGDMPYPQNYPKQDGEPPRVQPSQMNRANWPQKA